MKSNPHPNLAAEKSLTGSERLVQFALNVSGRLIALVNRTNGTLVSQGKKRTYLLYVPETYNPATPTPLVISLHGFGEWPAHQMQISHWNDLARQYGFIVVYPCGTKIPLRWNIYGLSGNNTDLMEDVNFISDLIDKLETEYNLDPARLYVNGLSNGGGMAFVLSCQLSERVAAIGSVSGAYTFPWSEYHPARPVPTILFHGTTDPIVPYLGGTSTASGFSLPSIPDWVDALARYQGCNDSPLPLRAVGAVSGIRYTNCTTNSEVIFYTIKGGGHAWPGGGSLPRFIVGNTNRDIDATKLMWDFFCNHPLSENE